MTVRRNSLDAYYGTVVPDLNKKQLQILKVMQHEGKDLTSQDLYSITGQPNNSVAPRVGELRDMGYIEKVGDRKISGRKHSVYRVTDKGLSVNLEKIPDIKPKQRHFTRHDYLQMCKEVKAFSESQTAYTPVEKALVYDTLKGFLNTKS